MSRIRFFSLHCSKSAPFIHSVTAMPYYEVLCLASGKLPRSELTSVITKTCRAFMDNGGTVTRIVPLGASGNGPRDLAYRIRINQISYHTAFYVNVCAFASPKALAEVSRQLRIDERVLRHLPIRKPLKQAIVDIPDVNATTKGGGIDPNDLQRAMREFLKEYEQQFPEGSSYTAADAQGGKNGQNGDVNTRGDGPGGVRRHMDSVMEKLKTKRNKEEKDGGLAWLSNLTKKDDKDPK